MSLKKLIVERQVDFRSARPEIVELEKVLVLGFQIRNTCLSVCLIRMFDLF